MSASNLITIPKAELVRNAWTEYVNGGALDNQVLRPEVANSWLRCRNLLLDPTGTSSFLMSASDLKDRLSAARCLMRIARQFMENLYSFVKGSGFEVILADANGVVLDVLGDEEILARTRDIRLCPGGNWSEAGRGTNAIGVALQEDKPLQIYAWEHYCQPHHFLTCSASPIHGEDGQLIGVLDMSGDYRAANPHTLGMVVAAVNAIEKQLCLQRATSQLITAYRYSSTLLNSMPDGLLSIDNRGIITELNLRGAEIFHTNPQFAKGRHISQIPGASETVLPVLQNRQGRECIDAVLENRGRVVSSSASLLRDEAGEVIGAVAVLHERTSRPSGDRTLLASGGYTFDDIAGISKSIVALKEWAMLAASSPFTVLIQGETGTGKELLAQAIHNLSARRHKSFVPINCGALPEGLIESELFGYEDGAFTGAHKGGRPGKFEAADHGTLFLDEIGDMPLPMQTKLLRTIQDGKVSRIGSTQERRVDVRIIAATHKDLKAEVERGTFREDLFYRLNVLDIHIPPLRERLEDIFPVVDRLVQKIRARCDYAPIEVEEGFLRKMQSYHWPGNIREVENAIERCITRIGNGGRLTPDLLDFPTSPAAPMGRPVALPKSDARSTSLREGEKEMICRELVACNGNLCKASARLGIGRTTLYRKMRAYGLRRVIGTSDSV